MSYKKNWKAYTCAGCGHTRPSPDNTNLPYTWNGSTEKRGHCLCFACNLNKGIQEVVDQIRNGDPIRLPPTEPTDDDIEEKEIGTVIVKVKGGKE